MNPLEPIKLLERAEPMKVKGEHELLTLHALVAQQEMDYAHMMSPQQKAWLMGCRSALAWALGLPKGGKMVEKFLEGRPLFTQTTATPGTDFLREQGIKLE